MHRPRILSKTADIQYVQGFLREMKVRALQWKLYILSKWYWNKQWNLISSNLDTRILFSEVRLKTLLKVTRLWPQPHSGIKQNKTKKNTKWIVFKLFWLWSWKTSEQNQFLQVNSKTTYQDFSQCCPNRQTRTYWTLRTDETTENEIMFNQWPVWGSHWYWTNQSSVMLKEELKGGDKSRDLQCSNNTSSSTLHLPLFSSSVGSKLSNLFGCPMSLLVL